MSVSILSVRSTDVVQYRDADGDFKTNITLTLFKANDTKVPLAIEVQIKEVDGDQWRQEALYPAGATTLTLFDVEVGVEYNIRVRLLYTDGTNSAWVSSWDDAVIAGTSSLPQAVVNSHTVAGNTRIPRDVANFQVRQSLNDTLVFDWDIVTVAGDLFGFEIRQFAGVTSDWDEMAILARVQARHYEAAFFTSQTYTFAVKGLYNAHNPTTGQDWNYSTNAQFFQIDYVDRSLVVVGMGAATAPGSISATYQPLTNYAIANGTIGAASFGLQFDPVAGTITTPNDGVSHFYRIGGHVYWDGSGNNVNTEIAFEGSTIGIVPFGNTFAASQTDGVTANGYFARQIPPNEVITLGLRRSSGSGGVTLIVTDFSLELIELD